MDNDEEGYFIVMPLYPFSPFDDNSCHYKLSVVKGSHKYKYDDTLPPGSRKCHLDDILHLDLQVGQVLVARANIWRRGGPNSNWYDLMGTVTFPNMKEVKIPAIKNVAIHGYLKKRGTNDASNDLENHKLIKLPKPRTNNSNDG